MQPPPRKVKLTQELRVHLLEQLSGLQSKQQRDAELLEDIRMQLWVGCPQMQGPAGTGGLAVLLGAKGQGVPSPCEPCAHRTAAAVWRGVIEGTAHAGQVRVTASESYRALAAEAARSARLSKERTLKKGIERLQKAQVELLETVKELDKAKKQFSHLQRSSEVAKDKAADVEARLRKSDRRIFHTKASLQKLSAKVSGVLAEHSRQLAGVQNEYSFALVSATAHLEHYQRVELPAAMQVGAARTPRAPLPGSHKDHAPPEGTGEPPAPHCSLLQVCREQDLLLFLQDHPAFSLAPEQRFQLTGVEEVSGRGGHNSKVGSAQPPLCHPLSLPSCACCHRQTTGPAWRRRHGETPTGLDPAEFDDYEDSDEPDEDEEPGPAARTYPYTCRVIFGYQVWPCLPGPHPAAQGWHLSHSATLSFLLQGCQADELSISQGEELEIIEDGDAEEWVKARNKAGQVGYVPEKYLLSLGCESGVLSPLPALPTAWLVRALYDYEGQSPEELSFPEGAIIRVLPRAPGEVDDGFWTGDFDGRIGVFPSLVVEELTGAREAAGQELPSPSPPPFSPPGLTPGASLVPSPAPETSLGGECWGNWEGTGKGWGAWKARLSCWALPGGRQEGTGSGQSSPDLAATRLRPVSPITAML
uniref:FCH and double SH3 domains 1 n=1 Tax=Malurus cyaneus samueli TaxID=2593467 RepID=A0A8C5U0U9_9PASS